MAEDARIKEEYIGYFFSQIGNYIVKLEKIKRNIERRIKQKSYENLSELIRDIDIRKERYDLIFTFDQIFLKLFPDFVLAFNTLLKPEDQIWPKDKKALNTNLRIFALMRLGVNDNEMIALILGCSVSTIYTYKFRIKSKAVVPVADFEKTIMNVTFAHHKCAST